MAGLGFKDFQVGEVLTAADVDGYLMQQSVMRFADAGARGSALGTATGTGVPLAEGMVSYLDDFNGVQVYNGTEWVATGKVLQVVSATYSTETQIASTSYADTGLTASITPSSASNKVLVVVHQPLTVRRNSNASIRGYVKLLRGATDIYGPTTGTGISAGTDGSTQVNSWGIWSCSYLDSPATTSSVTYKTQAAASTTSNFSFVETSPDDEPALMVLVEVAA